MCKAGQATREGFQANTSAVKGTAQAFEIIIIIIIIITLLTCQVCLAEGKPSTNRGHLIDN